MKLSQKKPDRVLAYINGQCHMEDRRNYFMLQKKALFYVSA